MIIDTIDNITSYYDNDGWNKAIAFLKTLSDDCEDGEYELEGDALFARVMTYDTKDVNDAYPEAHLKYVDIQVVLTGREKAFWYPLNSLAVKTPYDEANDAAFYYKNEQVASCLTLAPGLFAAFFPQDGHMPSIATDDVSAGVKKVVVKISVDYFI